MIAAPAIAPTGWTPKRRLDGVDIVIGCVDTRKARAHRLRLRTVAELFPEVIQGELDGDGLPSCSAAEALDRQEPFVNPTLAHHALALLARLFRYGTISYHGAFVGLSSLPSAQALQIDPKYWRRLRKAPRARQKQEYASHSRPAAGTDSLLAEQRKNLQRNLQQR